MKLKIPKRACCSLLINYSLTFFFFVLLCFVIQAPSQEYGGHSSHVTNVAFLHDDSHLISTGGKDTSILQWVVA